MQQFESEDKDQDEQEIKQDRSLLYFGIGVGVIVLIMGYLTFFVDGTSSWFSNEEKIETVIEGGSNSDILNENANMSDEEVRSSLVKFIEAFYRDQRKGYFDPPSYFAPITQTYYNYHNLTYKTLRETHFRKFANLKGYRLNWIVSSLDYDREGAILVATYWTSVNYINTRVNKDVSAEVKFEMKIGEDGKIVSLREVEIRNETSLDYYPLPDTLQSGIDYSDPVPVNSDPVIPLPPTTNIPGADSKVEEKLYDIGTVDIAPEFEGGQPALVRFLKSNLRYPAQARSNRVEGKVFIGFIVEKNGKLNDLKVIRGIGSGCDEEALRVLRSSPLWRPGTVSGKAVRTSYTIPITYQLTD